MNTSFSRLLDLVGHSTFRARRIVTMKPILMLPSIGALFFLSDHFDLRFDVVMVNRNIFQIWQNIATLVSSRYISRPLEKVAQSW